MGSGTETRHNKRRRNDEVMSVSEAYAALGLDPAVEHAEVQTTYRRLALLYHPDRNPGDRASLEHFKLLATAYRVLRHKFRTEEFTPGQLAGECDGCGKYDLLRQALDGTHCCVSCLGRANQRRMLPGPPMVIVSCAATIVLLALAGMCILLGGASSGVGMTTYSAMALGLGMLAMLSLAFTCVTIIYTAEPRHLQQQRKGPVARVRRHRREVYAGQVHTSDKY